MQGKGFCSTKKHGLTYATSTVAAICILNLILCASSQAKVVDRVVANVNGHAVLQSDWEEEVAFESFSDARDPASFTREERSSALDRLIDQELLREQLRPAQVTPPEQVAARVAAIRKLHAGADKAEADKTRADKASADKDEVWQAELERLGMTQSSLEKRVGEQLLLMKLVDDRLRPSVQVDQKAVEAYYKDHVVPEMSRSGSIATPLPEVSAKIRDLLAEKKMNELLSGWLASLRSTSQINTTEPGFGERTP